MQEESAEWDAEHAEDSDFDFEVAQITAHAISAVPAPDLTTVTPQSSAEPSIEPSDNWASAVPPAYVPPAPSTPADPSMPKPRCIEEMSLDEIEAELQSRRDQAKLAAGGTSSEQAQLIAADITAAAAWSEQAQLVAAAEAAAAEAAAAEAAAIAAAAAEAAAMAAAAAAAQALAEAESMAAEAASQQPQVECMTTAEIENELFQRTGRMFQTPDLLCHMPQEFDPTGYNPAMFHPHAQYGPPAGPYNPSLSPPRVPGAYVPGAPFIAPEPLPFIVAPEPQHLPFAANERMEKLQNDLARLRTGDEEAEETTGGGGASAPMPMPHFHGAHLNHHMHYQPAPPPPVVASRPSISQRIHETMMERTATEHRISEARMLVGPY